MTFHCLRYIDILSVPLLGQAVIGPAVLRFDLLATSASFPIHFSYCH